MNARTGSQVAAVLGTITRRNPSSGCGSIQR
jgi:hypothetical protein